MQLTQAEVDEAYSVALEHCQDDCRDYHITRPYLLASGVRRGPDRDADLFSYLLRELVKPKGTILIAGAADFGLLEFVHRHVGDRVPKIVVADRCRTPLILCERYAARHGLSIEVVETDLVTGKSVGQFDVVIAHALIQFVPKQERLGFLRHLAGMLAIEGRLLLAAGLGGTSSEMRARQTERVLEGLARHGISPPVPLDQLRAALDRQSNESGEPFNDDEAERDGLYRKAGLQVLTRHDSLRPPGATGLPRGRRYLVAGPL